MEENAEGGKWGNLLRMAGERQAGDVIYFDRNDKNKVE